MQAPAGFAAGIARHKPYRNRLGAPHYPVSAYTAKPRYRTKKQEQQLLPHLLKESVSTSYQYLFMQRLLSPATRFPQPATLDKNNLLQAMTAMPSENSDRTRRNGSATIPAPFVYFAYAASKCPGKPLPLSGAFSINKSAFALAAAKSSRLRNQAKALILADKRLL